MHFIYFLGRFHVLALHLPITLILVVAAMEWLNRGGRRPELEPALRLLWGATAITAAGTVVLGYMHFSEGGFTGPSALAHRALGTSVGIISIIGWWLWSKKGHGFHRAKAAVVVLLVVLVTLTGHFGGNLSHGSTYLVEYAPNVIRRVLGLQAARPPVTTVAAADPYLDVAQPIFAEHCLSCHNSDKKRGGLDLSSYATAIKGGKDGVVIVKGNAKDSDLIRRVSLSSGDEDFMPREGKPPLTADQIGILRWWIDSGAKTGVLLGSMQVPPDVQPLIAAQLHLDGASPATGRAATLAASPAVPQGQEIALGAAGAKVDPKVTGALVNAGFMARQVSLADAHLIVSPTTPGAQFSTAQIQTLASAGGHQITQLDLRDAGLTDAAAASVAQLTGLTQLRLDRNKLTDKTVQSLSGLGKLVVLGLYGNSGINDASVHALGQMRSLKRVFLWGTGITAAGIQKLKQARPDLMVDSGDETLPPAAPPQQAAAAASK